MKGMFLFQHEVGAPPEVDYQFQPYNYGPFTAEIYRDLEALEIHGFIASDPSGRNYRATESGRLHSADVAYDEDYASRLTNLRTELGKLGFRELLRRVYTSKPEFAAQSVARDVLNR